MARLIVKIRDRYLEWSTVVDAPVTGGMVLEAFREYYFAEHGHDSQTYFDKFIKRADATGASDDYNWRQNRAGPEETSLSEEELYQVYCLGQPLDEDTVRQKLAAKRAGEVSREAILPLPLHPTESDIRATFKSVSLGESLEHVQAALGPGENTSRKRGPWIRYRWVFGNVVVTCHFHKQSRTLCASELSPNWNVSQ